MISTMLVIVFSEAERAESVFHALNAMRRREMYSLDEAVLVARQSLAAARIERMSGADDDRLNVIEELVHLILARAESGADITLALGREFQVVGIDPHFVGAVADQLQGEFSALFFLIRSASRGDAGELRNVLSLFRGQIAHTTLSAEALAYLAARP